MNSMGFKKSSVVVSPQYDSVQEFLSKVSQAHGSKTAFSYFSGHTWNLASFHEVEKQSVLVAKQLINAGLKPQQRVGLVSETNLQWIYHFFGVLLAGGVVVPLDVKLAPTEHFHQLNHAEVDFLLFSDKHEELALYIRQEFKRPLKTLSIDTPNIQNGFWRDQIQSVDLKSRGLGRDQVSVICYTSGTSNQPKGVQISLDTLFFIAESLNTIDTRVHDNKVMFSIVPLNHLLGLTGGLLYALHCGYELSLSHSLEPQEILRSLNDRKVVEILCVPLFLKMLKKGIETRLKTQAPFRQKLFYFFLFLGRYIPGAGWKKKVFKTIHNRFGGHIKRFISGGSALDPEIFDFFKAIGMPVYEGYGLTETGPVISVSTEHKHKKGFAGIVIPGVDVKIDLNSNEKEGEILVRGPNVMKGYFKNSELTKESLTDEGWFRTGDVGFIDPHGFLKITGRKKSMIVLSSGKKVFPEEVESCVLRTPYVQDVCVLGIKSQNAIGENVVAVIFPNQELKKNFSDSKLFYQKMLEHVRLECRQIAEFKRPTRYYIRETPFEITSSHKIKRQRVLEEIESGELKQ